MSKKNFLKSRVSSNRLFRGCLLKNFLFFYMIF